MSVSCGCMDVWIVFLMLILLTRFSQRGSLMSGGQRATHVPRGFSRLQYVDQHLKEMGMGQADAWGMARRRPLEYWRKVDAVTRCSDASSHT